MENSLVYKTKRTFFFLLKERKKKKKKKKKLVFKTVTKHGLDF